MSKFPGRTQPPRTTATMGGLRTRSPPSAALTPPVLMSYGMAETLLDDLKPQLAEYEDLVNKANAGRRAHVGARARLLQILAELMELTHQLDGINEYRFRDDAEKFAAWESARDFAWPRPKPKPTAA